MTLIFILWRTNQITCKIFFLCNKTLFFKLKTLPLYKFLFSYLGNYCQRLSNVSVQYSGIARSLSSYVTSYETASKRYSDLINLLVNDYERLQHQINETNTGMILRSSGPEVFYKKLFFKILQNSWENVCAKVSFLIKL